MKINITILKNKVSMDSAFERRFLYKITFDKPNKEDRKGIRKAMLPDLSEIDAAQLANKFEITGRQIENIARKIEVDSILDSETFNIDKLSNYCKIEINSSFNKDRIIGFGA